MSSTIPAEAPPTPGPAFGGDRSDVSSRLEALAAAVEAARGRIDDETLDPAAELSERAAERLRLSGEHTIVALAGATGSGKSSLFNAPHRPRARGRRRPTSHHLMGAGLCVGSRGRAGPAGVDGHPGASPGVAPQHARPLGRGPEARRTRAARPARPRLHRGRPPPRDGPAGQVRRRARMGARPAEVRRRRHPRPLHPSHGVVQATSPWSCSTRSIASPTSSATVHSPTSGASSTTRDWRASRSSAPRPPAVTASRSSSASSPSASGPRRRPRVVSVSDITGAAKHLAEVGGTSQVPGIGPRRPARRSTSRCSTASACPRSSRPSRRPPGAAAARLTGWPVTRWLVRRSDPLQELGIDPNRSISRLARASEVPGEANVQRAQAETAVRDFAEKASVGLTVPWRDAVRGVSTSRSDDIVIALDRAIIRGRRRRRPGGHVVASRQRRPVAGARRVRRRARLVRPAACWRTTPPASSPTHPNWRGYGLPVLLAAGGLVVGIGLAVLSRIAGWVTARLRARKAERLLTRGHRGSRRHPGDLAGRGPSSTRTREFRTNILRARD